MKYRLQISGSRLNVLSGFGLLLPCILENRFIRLNHITSRNVTTHHNSRNDYVWISLSCLLTL